MKNLFLLTVLLLFAEALSVNKAYESQSFLNEFRYEITVTTLIALMLSSRYFLKNRVDIYCRIWFHIILFRIKIFFNKRSAKKLRKRVRKTQLRFFRIGNISEQIKGITNDNIVLWKNQAVLHERIIDVCKLNIFSLIQHKNDLRLLRYLLKQVGKEPNSKKKVDRLEKSINKISKNINPIITNEIDKLIRELKTDTRKGKILRLEARIVGLESKVGSAI